MNVFLTGTPQTGKTTAIRRFLAAHPALRPGGFVTASLPSREPGARWDVLILPPVWSPADARPARRVGIRGGGGGLFPRAFETAGRDFLAAPGPFDLLLMDELGRMELGAPGFCAAVLAALDGPVPVLGVIKPESNPLLDAVRAHPHTLLWELTEENRDRIPARLADCWQDAAHTFCVS